MHRCSVIAVGTDDFPTSIPSCYSYCQCGKLYYSTGDGLFESIEKCFLPFPPCAILDINPSWILAVLVCKLKFLFLFCLAPSYHISCSSQFSLCFHITRLLFCILFFPILRRQVVMFYQTRVTPSCGLVYLLKYQQVPLHPPGGFTFLSCEVFVLSFNADPLSKFSAGKFCFPSFQME